MIQRTTDTVKGESACAALVQALWTGIGAMADPAVEARVLEYFLRYPSDSRDMVSIAAVACRVRDRLAAELSEDLAAPKEKIVSHSH